MNAAAVILCAGKGTRMNDDSQNKVCFDCAGTPVIRRIVDNMKKGGVDRFVIVVGHKAESVMSALSGVEGVVYAYQKEQKGTGHAALCGIKALKSIGYVGPVIVSMGDKIVDHTVIRDFIEKSNKAKAVWGVQPILANKSGGRVVEINNKPYGIVEFADASFMALDGVKEENWEKKLSEIGLNAKKAQKVLQKAKTIKPCNRITLCGVEFTAQEILNSRYANAGLYCFDTTEAIKAIATCNSQNAQGEIYLTDTLEYFAKKGEAVLYEIKDANLMLTYSTKPELAKISEYFLNYASSFISKTEDERIKELFSKFIEVYGNKKAILTSAPGRLNLMGRHIDHRGGNTNVLTINRETILAVSPRDDDIVNIANVDGNYPSYSFSIGEYLNLNKNRKWLDYINSEELKEDLEKNKGHWANYFKAAVLRFQFENEMPLKGMNIMASGNIPVAAGLSSSSSIVVATAEAVVALNSLNLTDKEFIDLCGEGEWFVGSRGGAGDHAAMKCSRKNFITALEFKPFRVGKSVAFSNNYAIIVADSCQKAKKSEGCKDIFNEKIASYEIALMYLKKNYSMYNFVEFRDIANVTPRSKIYEMLKSLKQYVTRNEILKDLPEYKDKILTLFETHKEPEFYDLRGVTLYGVSECVRAKTFIEMLENNEYQKIGEIMKISHDGDRLTGLKVTDKYLDELIKTNKDIAFVSGVYACSTEKIDYLCDLLNSTEGVLGSQLVGAGLGGCVVAIVEKEKANAIIDNLNKNYYDKFEYNRSANVYLSSNGSKVAY
ncbi:MAG: NTP transferase domain-containing protein [Clostridia bacterium]|nr:NTP transferase domain-containing protein [Clostridia bacterium]